MAAAILLSGCTPGDGGGSIAPATAPPAGGGIVSPGPEGSSPWPAVDQPTVVGKIDAELQVPWSTIFLPDGTAVISERETALLRSIAPGSGNGRAGTIGKVPDVDADREGGLLGLALSPDFARDRY
ncbi:MAG TPA: PQQ-dependent sugar dehydrogenase, partial [Arthrobacter sp.]|nr:PQQ-dependent sugar dehydrogenase [Arthrobacter sp.]